MTSMDGRMLVLMSSPLSEQLALLSSLRRRRILNGCEVEGIRDDARARVGIYASETPICARSLRCYRAVKTSLRTHSTTCRAERSAGGREHRGSGIDPTDAAIALAFGRIVDSCLDIVVVLCLNARPNKS